jgi:hypothetical protein
VATRGDEVGAGRELRTHILARLADERGVHAETAVSAAARMAGSFLLRSFDLPIATLEPGAPLLSDMVNDEGPALVEILVLALDEMKIPIDRARASAANQGGVALLTVLQVQERLEVGCTAIAKTHGLDYRGAARAAAFAAAFLVQATKDVLDPSTAFGIAAYGFVEGAKTVPQRLPDGAGLAKKKPWYKLW